MVYCCNIFGSFLINKKKSTLGFSGASAAGGFTLTFIVTNIVIYQLSPRISNLNHPTLDCCYCQLPVHTFRAKNRRDTRNPRKSEIDFFKFIKNDPKIFFHRKLDPRVRKLHNQGLKHDIQIWPPHPHLGVGVEQKVRKTPVFTTSRRFLTYSASLQAKMNASIVFSTKKSLEIQVFSSLANLCWAV